MPAKKKEAKNTCKVKVGGKVGDGKGGYFKKGDTFEAANKESAAELKKRGLIE